MCVLDVKFRELIAEIIALYLGGAAVLDGGRVQILTSSPSHEMLLFALERHVWEGGIKLSDKVQAVQE